MFRTMIPTPNEIFSRFESGEIDRDELHALMALNARELISEMEEDHLNPAAALLEGLLTRRAAARLVGRHGGRLIREMLQALSEVRDFPPARRLWNASHPDVPLYCFFRIRREPVFEFVSVEKQGADFLVRVRHGRAAKKESSFRTFVLRRGPDWKLRVADDGVSPSVSTSGAPA